MEKEYDFQDKIMKDIPAFALLSLGSLALGEASGYVEPERELGSPMEMST